MSDQFRPNSIDSMFATIIAKQEADTTSREAFRSEIRERFDRGSVRMDAQDSVLAAIKEQATKTNGRVTRIEEAELTRRLELLELAEISHRTEDEISHRTEDARRKWIMWVVSGAAGFLCSIASALGTWWLSKR